MTLHSMNSRKVDQAITRGPGTGFFEEGDGSPKAPQVRFGTRIQSVARAFGILLWLAGRPAGAAAKEVAFANRLTLSTTYHLLNTLEAQGLVTRTKRRRYVLGSRAVALSPQAPRARPLPHDVVETLRQLSAEVGESAQLLDWEDEEIRVLASVEGMGAVRRAVVAAPYADAHARAAGKILLAYADASVRESFLNAHPLRKLTPSTIVEWSRLDEELARVRERGLAYDDEEFAAGVACVAAPLIRNGGFLGAIGISMSADSFRPRRLQLTELLRRTVGAVTGAL